MAFPGIKPGRDRRKVRPAVLQRSVEALERRDLLALVLTPLSFTDGVVFSGKVATFAASDLQGTVTDFKPTISWGDGTTSSSSSGSTSSAGTAQVVQDGTGFDVVALSKTYSQFGTFPVTVTVAGMNNTLVSASGSATVADAPLTPTGTTFTATEGQLFNGVVGSFQDVNTTSQPGDFTLKIDWGDNQTSLGTAVALPTGQTVSQRYNVTGSHVYAATGMDPVKVQVVRSSSGQTVTAASTANVIAPALNLLTGGLDPTSVPRFFRHLMVTNQQEPTISGTAAPGASVSLSIRRLGLGDPITIGETVADPNGHWSLVVGPLGGSPFLLYGVASPVANPPTPITLLNGGIPILVTNRSLHGVSNQGGRDGLDHARMAARHRGGHGRG